MCYVSVFVFDPVVKLIRPIRLVVNGVDRSRARLSSLLLLSGGATAELSEVSLLVALVARLMVCSAAPWRMTGPTVLEFPRLKVAARSSLSVYLHFVVVTKGR